MDFEFPASILKPPESKNVVFGNVVCVPFFFCLVAVVSSLLYRKHGSNCNQIWSVDVLGIFCILKSINQIWLGTICK